MKKHLKYLSYVIKHKWFVFLAGLKLLGPTSNRNRIHLIFRLIIHDWSKFLPSEWNAYVNYFYSESKTHKDHESFDQAWNYHQKRNKHHWQYWILINDNPIRMPEIYLLEMIADWAGAGRAITGKWEVADWYRKNRDNIILHNHTRPSVELMLGYFDLNFNEGKTINEIGIF